MENQKTNEKFIDELSALYEEGKDCLFNLSILETEKEPYNRLFDILKEMRDLSINNYQTKDHGN